MPARCDHFRKSRRPIKRPRLAVLADSGRGTVMGFPAALPAGFTQGGLSVWIQTSGCGHGGLTAVCAPRDISSPGGLPALIRPRQRRIKSNGTKLPRLKYRALLGSHRSKAVGFQGDLKTRIVRRCYLPVSSLESAVRMFQAQVALSASSASLMAGIALVTSRICRSPMNTETNSRAASPAGWLAKKPSA